MKHTFWLLFLVIATGCASLLPNNIRINPSRIRISSYILTDKGFTLTQTSDVPESFMGGWANVNGLRAIAAFETGMNLSTLILPRGKAIEDVGFLKNSKILRRYEKIYMELPYYDKHNLYGTFYVLDKITINDAQFDQCALYVISWDDLLDSEGKNIFFHESDVSPDTPVFLMSNLLLGSTWFTWNSELRELRVYGKQEKPKIPDDFVPVRIAVLKEGMQVEICLLGENLSGEQVKINVDTGNQADYFTAVPELFSATRQWESISKNGKQLKRTFYEIQGLKIGKWNINNALAGRLPFSSFNNSYSYYKISMGWNFLRPFNIIGFLNYDKNDPQKQKVYLSLPKEYDDFWNGDFGIMIDVATLFPEDNPVIKSVDTERDNLPELGAKVLEINGREVKNKDKNYIESQMWGKTLRIKWVDSHGRINTSDLQKF